jgi:hypothetical protein
MADQRRTYDGPCLYGMRFRDHAAMVAIDHPNLVPRDSRFPAEFLVWFDAALQGLGRYVDPT